MEELLSVKGISKSYGANRVLKDISFSLYAGQCLTLMGVNGAGKTTLCEIIQGLIVADQGEVVIFGRNLKKAHGEIIPQIGVVLQGTQLYKRFSVEETLRLFASFYPQKISPWGPLLELLELDSKKHTLLKNLSGGQRQKVCLACALIHDPKLLLWDEPTTGLDPQSQEQVWRLIDELKKQGRGLLLTTHNLEEAEYLSDRLALIDQGRIFADGSLAELVVRFARHTSLMMSLEKRQEASFESLLEELRSYSGVQEVLSSAEGEVELRFQASQRDVLGSGLLALIHKAGFDPHNISLQRGSLREVYRSLTGRVLD